ncbi:MAG TPA: hypothetical protein VI076_16585 [Actinopolymorphaceae bacterium]
MSTTEQIERFQRDGVLFLPRTLPPATALTLRDRLWAFLSAMHRRRQDDPTTWEPLEGRTRFKVLMRTDAFAELRRYLSEPITDVLGSAWDPPTYWGHPLVTFPDSRPCTPPRRTPSTHRA